MGQSESKPQLLVVQNPHGPKRIPRILHQTYKNHMHSKLQANVKTLRTMNPNWEYRLYTNDDHLQYIKRNYGQYMLNMYLKINPKYGAARADFFRYLVMYREGGVYLDIKSGCRVSLDYIIHPEDTYILSYWKDMNFHEELGGRGEIQQWHIICVPNHPFLAAVIDRVVYNIQTYDPKVDGVGGLPVLRTTGPFAYTLSIRPLLSLYPHKMALKNEDLGLIYVNLKGGQTAHRKLYHNKHYSQLDDPIIL